MNHLHSNSEPVIMQFHFWKITWTLFLVCAISITASCATSGSSGKGNSSTIFYPPLPNKPRIQFLTTINAAWVQGSKRNSFSDFILGKEEINESRLTKPYGVTYYDNKLFVVDTRGPGYAILSADDELIKIVKGSGSGRMTKPINIFIDKEGNRYITDTYRNQVLMFDINDNFVRAYGRTNQFKPSDIIVLEDNLYISDLENHVIHILDKKSGFTRGMIGRRGSSEGELFYPTNMSLNQEGNILVSDTGNYRLQLFSPRGNFIKQFGEAGSSLGQFARPKGIAVDKEGRIYAIDSAFENVQLFDAQGRLLLYFGQPGNEKDNINMPADISIQYEGIEDFEKFADSHFKIKYLILVSSQFGPNKVSVFGFGDYVN